MIHSFLNYAKNVKTSMYMLTAEKERLDYLIGEDDLENEKFAAQWNRYKKMNNYSFCFPSFLSNAFYTESLSEKENNLNSSTLVNKGQDLNVREVNSKTCENVFDKIITIRVKPNNTFCTLKSLFHDQMVSASSTKYSVKMSKKSLRYNYKIVLKAFLKEVDNFIRSDKILFSITAPKRIRRELIRILKTSMKPTESNEPPTLNKTESQVETDDDDAEDDVEEPSFVVFKLNAKKCFNGCRVRKKKRKKQRGLRIYK